MAKHYLFKRPEPRFEGQFVNTRSNDGFLVESEPDLSRGSYRSAWFAYDLALQSVSKGADLLTILGLRKKVQGLQDALDAQHDAKYLVVTEQEKRLLASAVTNFDWTFPDAKGNSRSSFFVNWMALFEAVLDSDSSNYGFIEYDITRPSPEYVADTADFDARKSELDARLAKAKDAYAAARAKQAASAPAADPVPPADTNEVPA